MSIIETRAELEDIDIIYSEGKKPEVEEDLNEKLIGYICNHFQLATQDEPILSDKRFRFNTIRNVFSPNSNHNYGNLLGAFWSSATEESYEIRNQLPDIGHLTDILNLVIVATPKINTEKGCTTLSLSISGTLKFGRHGFVDIKDFEINITFRQGKNNKGGEFVKEVETKQRSRFKAREGFQSPNKRLSDSPEGMNKDLEM
ncbi:MAG: hypothetical protein Q9M91_01720 [Candidatus Dojkabacteria bacterium]|nr:hypothetical protein [Candidatus Dojkabacteria bacterium]MDQ7020542.1 hypothetical protein [Candidatus Dojkabacteria bacterium]